MTGGYCGMPAATQAATTSCWAVVTHVSGRGVLKQPIAIGIQPSMIAGSVHSPMVFGIVFASPSLNQPDGASVVLTGFSASA